MNMVRIAAKLRCWIRSLYWMIYTLPIWDRLVQFYNSIFRKNLIYDVDGNQYNDLFLSPPKSFDIQVDSRVWNRAAGRLPEDYTIPDRSSLKALNPTTGDYYNNLFSNPRPVSGIYVDSKYWNRIKEELPETYSIPDQMSVRTFKPMSADYYNKLFNSPVPILGVVVDSNVWGPITADLPPDYRLPDSAMVDVLKKKRDVGK